MSTVLLETRRAQDRKRAKIIGILFLAAFAVYGAGYGLVTAALEAPDDLSVMAGGISWLGIGAVLMLINSMVVAAIGVLMLPVARPHGESVATGYLASRIIEAVLLAVGVVFLLAAGMTTAQPQSLITANDLAYQGAMIALGLGSIPLWRLAYRSQLIPRFLAAFAIVGYASLLGGAVAAILGVDADLILSIPGGLFEVSLGIWLIAKGFNDDAGSESAASLATDRGALTADPQASVGAIR